MSKELEALARIKKEMIYQLQTKGEGIVDDDFHLIETALKRLEELEKPKEIAGTTTISEATKQSLLEWCPDIEKKLKAFEIINKKMVDAYWVKFSRKASEYNSEMRNQCGLSDYEPFLLTQEEFDLLKEVLI